MKLSESWCQRLQEATDPLPGLAPYANVRRLSVGGRYDHAVLRDFLTARHPHISIAVWQCAADECRLRLDGQLCRDLSRCVRAGNVLSHLIENVVEPPVSTQMRLLYEDDQFLAIDKPAPLPVHPSGRYNRHTVVSFLKAMYPEQEFKPVHRIDADTTGVLLLARHGDAARMAGQCFRDRQFSKVYLARVRGRWSAGSRLIEQAIGKCPVDKGARRLDGSASGLSSETSVERLGYFEADDSSLLRVVPVTGRTNQIRLHLASAGHPIVGDQAYGDSADGSYTGGAFTSGFLCLHAHRLMLPPLASGLEQGLQLESPPPDWARPSL